MKDSSHNVEKIRYEYRAKNTLAVFFPDEFGHLEKSEKPDWIDSTNNIGVEVVRVLDSDCLEERRSFSKKFAGKSKLMLSPKLKVQLSKYNGRTYTARELGISDADVIVSHCHTVLVNVDMILSAINRKIKLLGDYENFDRTYLYVLCDTNISCAEIGSIFISCHELQQKSEKKFRGIFIDDGVKMYRHDFCNGTTSERNLSDVAQQVFVRTKMEIKNV